MLAHIFAKEGDVMGYLYDFGDKWTHEIVVRIDESALAMEVLICSVQVETILPLGDSDGHAEVLAAEGMCPGGMSFMLPMQYGFGVSTICFREYEWVLALQKIPA